MKLLIVCFGLVVTMLLGHASATQNPSEDAKKSDAVMMKFRQIDLLNQLIPLALTKDQIEKLLPSVERARAKVRETEKDEAKTLASYDKKITDEINRCIEKGEPPKRELLQELAVATKLMADNRSVIASENTEAVLKVFKETLNAGQLKAAENSLKPELFDPSLKSDKMTSDDKLRFFIRDILLDPQAYDVLVRLDK